jgi:eukaryotic-like serine/threonine-protein kinase
MCALSGGKSPSCTGVAFFRKRGLVPPFHTYPSAMALREDVSERAQARVGSVLKGKWRLERVIGVGGMATVFSATHRNQARVAIKMLHPEIALDAEVTTRFLREGYVANAVGHPGTVAVLDDDVSEDDVPFLVMELLEGETLESRWSRKGERLPATEVLPIVDQLLDVLAAAHDKGVVHRDLKPENLFLTADGRLKVLDFGIARLRELSQTSAATTRAGSLLGTPAFMAPEQARGRWDLVDDRTDIWAVGATLFTLLGGRFVHEAETLQEQLVLAATRRAPPVASIVPELPAALANLVDRALAFDKAERFADARAMREALRQVMGSAISEIPLSLPRPSLRDHDDRTLIAPPEVTSAITGKVDTLTTARPFMRDKSDPPPARARRRALVLGASALGLVALVALGVRFVPRPPEAVLGSARVSVDLGALRRSLQHDDQSSTPAANVPPPAKTERAVIAAHGKPVKKPHPTGKPPERDTQAGLVPSKPGQTNPEGSPFDRRH